MASRTVSRRASSGLGFLVVVAPIGGALLIAACADALHLDPPGASSASSTSGSSSSSTGSSSSGSPKADGGSDAGAPCNSNPDCAYPFPVCDTTTHVCVECLVVSDCSYKPGTICSLGTCQCAAPPNAPLLYCENESPACIDGTSSPTNCGGCGNICFGGCAASKCSSPWLEIPAGLPNAPEARSQHVAAWTGSEMFVWGGLNAGGSPLGDGALYNPATHTWRQVSSLNAPEARYGATAVWDPKDELVLVWGGASNVDIVSTGGGRYDPKADAWTPIPPPPASNAPGGTIGHTAVWATNLTGLNPTTAAMITWGGFTDLQNTATGTGGIYDPTANGGAGAWVGAVPDFSATTSIARGNHVAFWDSNGRMVVFGGQNGGALADGNTYSFVPPSAWSMISGGATQPEARVYAAGDVDPITHQGTFVGGQDLGGVEAGVDVFNDAFTLLPAGAGWSSIGGASSPVEARVNHTAVFVQPTPTTSQFVVFGGTNPTTGDLGDGFATTLAASGTWQQLGTPGPSARAFHTAVSTGSTMIIFGGIGPAGTLGDGAIYNAAQ